MSIAILVFSVLAFIFALLIWICNDERSDIFLPIMVLCFGILFILCIFNISFERNSNEIYNPLDKNMVITNCKIDGEYTKYTYNIKDKDGYTVGKKYRFIDDIGKYNIGDTITFNKN